MALSLLPKLSCTPLFIILTSLQLAACGEGLSPTEQTPLGAGVINSPAIISGVNTGRVTEDVDPDNDNLLEADGKLSIIDNDSGEAAFSAGSSIGSYGDLSIDAAGNWLYTANNGQPAIQDLMAGVTLNDRITVRSADGTTYDINITIVGVDEVGVPGDIHISWVAPSQRQDNSALSLSEIAGYKIYYGSAQGQYSSSIVINDGSTVDYNLQNLNPGAYYIVITTIDTFGRESTYSTESVAVI